MTILAAVPLLAWLYLLLFRGGFWRARKNRISAEPLLQSDRHVVAVIPARDEAAVIERSVGSLLRQSHRVDVIVIDDGSSDGTGDLARSVAFRLGAADRLTVLTGTPLPSGWSGKLWALSQGVDYASNLHPDYLLFTDADIEHDPRNVAQLLAVAEHGGYQLASLMAKLECHTLAERLLIPAFVYFFFQLYPPASIESRQSSVAGAAGGCILLRPAALAASGGLEMMRAAVIDDCTLAAQVKCNGGKIWLALTESARSIRSYGSFQDIADMIARTAFNQLNHSAFLLFAAVSSLALVYVVPPVFAVFGSGWPRVLGIASWGLMTISYLPMVRFYKRASASALLLPAIAIFYGCATVLSALRFWRGKGGLWKGRVQDPASRLD